MSVNKQRPKQREITVTFTLADDANDGPRGRCPLVRLVYLLLCPVFPDRHPADHHAALGQRPPT